MLTDPYGYTTRKGIYPIAWGDFHGICKALAKAASHFAPEMVLAIGRGGYYAGALIAQILQTEIYTVRVSRRVKDIITYKNPRWLAEPPAHVQGQRVLIVDEICSSGETISMVKERVEAMGATEVKSAVLYAHTWGASVPDYIGLITDALVLNPWDREVLKEGVFQFHPEYVEALAHQGKEPDSSLLIAATAFELAKG